MKNSIQVITKETAVLFKSLLDDGFDMLKDYNNEENEWEEIKNNNDKSIKLERMKKKNAGKPLSNNFYPVRGTYSIKTKKTAFEIAQMASAISYHGEKGKYGKEFKKSDPTLKYYRRLLDKSSEGIKNIDSIDNLFKEDFCVVHGRFTSGSKLVYDRDLLFVRETRKINDNQAIYCGKSFSLKDDIVKKFPKDKGCVRGEVIVFGFIITKIEENNYNVVYIQHMDPCGFIPPTIYNSVSKNVAYSCKRVMDQINPLLKKEIKNIFSKGK